MNDKSRKHTKREFIHLLRNTGAEAAKAKPQLQSDLQYIHYFEQLADPYADWVEATMPDDAYAAPSDVGVWVDAHGKIRSPQLRSLDISSIAASTATFVYSVIGEDVNALPADRRDQAKEARRTVANVLAATSWDTELEDEFRRLGLDQTGAGYTSALVLYRQAHDAVRTPTGVTTNPAGALIRMRSCIDRVLDDLKPKCKCQRKTRKRRDKIMFIWEQMGKRGTNADEVKALAMQVENLNGDLSEAKSKDLGEDEIRQRFTRSVVFLKAFLSKLDEGRMRKP